MLIKNHEILHEIHRGALTTVYRARHLNLDRPVLLKVLNQQWLREQDLLERFRREARISAKLQHPNIVNVYDFEISPELVFISLEFVEGRTLRELITSGHPLPFERIKSILFDVLNALDYAHKNGVIHRDIKPTNIMLDENGMARLTDFGLASLQESAGVTAQGQLVGTPAYMAPELVRGEPASVQSDLYSTGITLYEMLTGESPFQQQPAAATLQRVLAGEVKPATELRPEIPVKLTHTLNRMVAKNPTERPESVGKILADLRGKTAKKKSSKHNSSSQWQSQKLLFAAIALAVVLSFSFLMFWPDVQSEIMDHPVQTATKNTQIKQTTEPVFEQKNATPEPPPVSKHPNQQDNAPIKEIAAKSIDTAAVESKSTHGTFVITCSPWANVFVNGDSIDTTPLKHAISLPAGTHTIALMNPNYATETRTIEILPGETQHINIKLQPAFGYLKVKAAPWASIYIDENYHDDTPLHQPLVVSAGKHVLRLQHPGYTTITDTIVIEVGKTIERTYAFEE